MRLAGGLVSEAGTALAAAAGTAAAGMRPGVSVASAAGMAMGIDPIGE
jgi:hypothetical protein